MAVASTTRTLAERCKPIELLVLDVDGVLTDGSIIINDLGVESKAFNVRDGGGIALWRKAGKKVAIISGRAAECVNIRAEELGIAPVIQGSADKKTSLTQVLQDVAFDASQTCAIGDDVADLRMLSGVGLAACPADAVEEVQAVSHYVATRSGGRGAVREIIELILKEQGLWDGVITPYQGRV